MAEDGLSPDDVKSRAETWLGSLPGVGIQSFFWVKRSNVFFFFLKAVRAPFCRNPFSCRVC